MVETIEYSFTWLFSNTYLIESCFLFKYIYQKKNNNILSKLNKTNKEKDNFFRVFFL